MTVRECMRFFGLRSLNDDLGVYEIHRLSALNDCFVFWIAMPQCGSQWLYRQQEEGMLNNYILYMPIILFEEDLRKLKLRF